MASTSRPLRILEIGAGTGGTTAAILPALPPDRVVYYFTDLSHFFLSRAESRFQDYPFVRYGVLDIERDPAEQDLPAHSIDVIVATNVLHATKDLRQTMKHVRSLLAESGVLLMNEVTVHPDWLDLGLVEGWERFDDDLRTDTPVLAVDQWRDLLLAQGFDEVIAFPRTGSPAEVLGQHVIVGGVSSGVGERDASAAVWGTARADTRLDQDDDQDAAGRVIEEFTRTLNEALPLERTDLLIGYVRDHVASVLRMGGAEPPGPRQRLMDLGIDSLMAVELRNRLASGLGAGRSLPATLMFDYPTIEAIAGYLGKHVLGFEDDQVRTDGRASDLSGTAARLEQLSEEEAEMLLLKKLEKL